MNYFDILLSGKITAHEEEPFKPEDVGKVVTESGGEYSLTEQTARSITENGTYDTTLNNEVTVNVPSSGGRDWSEIGYSAEPPTIEEGFEYAKQIAQNYTPSSIYQNDKFMRFMPFVNTTGRTNFGNMFNGCNSLIYVPQLDTSSGTVFGNMFRSCAALHSLPMLDLSEATDMQWFAGSAQSFESFPQYDTSKVTNMTSMCYFCTSLKNVPVLNTSVCTDMSASFKGCDNLTDASLNNILLMCANSAVTSSKTLATIGLSSAQKTKCQTLSNWSAFVAAGWTA